MIYSDTGINWIFPYEVMFEDELILILKVLPRQHKRNRDYMASVSKWIRVESSYAVVDGVIKLVELHD